MENVTTLKPQSWSEWEQFCDALALLGADYDTSERGVVTELRFLGGTFLLDADTEDDFNLDLYDLSREHADAEGTWRE